MPAITNTYLTEGPNAGVDGPHTGERESLDDVIRRISPTEVPFYSNGRMGSASAVLEEWLVQELEAPSNTAQPEGNDSAYDAVKKPDRWGNYASIRSRNAIVSGTIESVDKAGRGRESAYQRILKGLEVRRDVEVLLTQNVAKSGSDPRETAGFPTWVTNGSTGATGNLSSGNGTDVVVEGTDVDLTIDAIDDTLEESYIEGGDINMLMFTPTLKRAFSKLQGNIAQNEVNITRRQAAAMIGTISTYLSDFGFHDTVINRFMPAKYVFLIDTRHYESRTLPGRSFVAEKRAKTGDANKQEIIWEGTLVVGAPKAHGLLAGQIPATV